MKEIHQRARPARTIYRCEYCGRVNVKIETMERHAYNYAIAQKIADAIDEKQIASHERETEAEIARRMYQEYEQWLSKWDGDYPNEREHTTFTDWLEGRE